MSRGLLKLLGLLLLAAGIGYTVALIMVLVVSQQDQRRPADAIVVLGAAQYNGRPSPVLKARLDHAVELYRDHLAPRIIVTGGVGRGDTMSEAAVSRRYLLFRGVRDTAIVVRPQGRSTYTSMTVVAHWLQLRGHSRVILVSDPFHMCRLRLEARRTELRAWVRALGGPVRRAFCVHGEPSALEGMAEILRDEGVQEVHVPAHGQSFDLS